MVVGIAGEGYLGHHYQGQVIINVERQTHQNFLKFLYSRTALATSTYVYSIISVCIQ